MALGLAGPAAAVGGGAVTRPLAYRILKGDPPSCSRMNKGRAAEAAEEPGRRRRRRRSASSGNPEDCRHGRTWPPDRVRGQAARRRRPRRHAAREQSAGRGELALDKVQWTSSAIADDLQRDALRPRAARRAGRGHGRRAAVGRIVALSEQQRARAYDAGAAGATRSRRRPLTVWAERVVARTYKKRYEGLEGAPSTRTTSAVDLVRRGRRCRGALLPGAPPPHYLFAWSPTTT